MEKDCINLDQHYKLLIDQSPFHVTYFDLELKILYINSFGRDFMGMTDEKSYIGKSILDFMLDEVKGPFYDLIKSINEEKRSFDMENRHTDRTGKVHWFSWIDKGIYNEKGALIGYQSIGQDITSKKEVELEFLKSQKRLVEAQILGNLGDWEWDVKTDKSYWSAQTFRLLGFAPGEFEPTQEFYRSLILPDDRDLLVKGQNEAFASRQETYRTEYPLKIARDSIVWIRDQGRIEYDESGNASRVIGTILDITESKELQLSLENHIRTEKTLLEVSNIFMTTETSNLAAGLIEALKIIGAKADADRAVLLTNDLLSIDDGTMYSYPENVDSNFFGDYGAADDILPGGIEDLYENGIVIISDTSKMNRKLKKHMNVFLENKIGAIICVALYHRNNIGGYLYLVREKPSEVWSSVDGDFFRLVAEMCVGALEAIKSRRELEREKEILALTLMSIGDGFISMNSRGRVEFVNDSALKLLGIERPDVHGKLLEDAVEIKSENDNHVINLEELRYIQVLYGQEYRKADYLHPDGNHRIFSISSTSIPSFGREGAGCAMIFRDITEESARQKEIKFLSFHDSLTGVYNRAFMEVELSRLDTERQLPLSVIMGDVNGLKMANDVFGHKEGDKLLNCIAEIIVSCCREEDVIARWGGDEFSIILPSTDQKIADRICDRIRSKCDRRKDSTISPSIALGSATKNTTDELMDDIVREAEDRMYRQKLLDDRSVRSDILSSLKKTMFEKSFETEAHTKRMNQYATIFGKAINLPSNLQSDLNLLAIMHDMGKIAVPSNILGKKEKLTEEDWLEIKKHPEAGYRIAQSSIELTSIAEYILCHHERWDGNGYPRGLKGEEIPELSRIISIIDTYDVITNGRVYKDGVPSEVALKEIERCSGTQFDPRLAKLFVSLMKP